MRHKTISQFESAVREHCKQCQGAKKLHSAHCSDTKCIWYDDRKSLIQTANQLTLFTSNGFYDECIKYLTANYKNMLSRLWWSEIRLELESHLDKIRASRPNKNWWGALQGRLKNAGWVKDNSTKRISPITRSEEYLYFKSR